MVFRIGYKFAKASDLFNRSSAIPPPVQPPAECARSSIEHPEYKAATNEQRHPTSVLDEFVLAMGVRSAPTGPWNTNA